MLTAELVLQVYQVDSYIIWIVWFSLMPMFDDAVLFFICAMPLVACLYLMIHGLSLRSDFGLGWARALLLACFRQIMKEMYYELVFVSWNPSLLLLSP